MPVEDSMAIAAANEGEKLAVEIIRPQHFRGASIVVLVCAVAPVSSGESMSVWDIEGPWKQETAAKKRPWRVPFASRAPRF